MADKKNGNGDARDARTFTIQGRKYTIHPSAEMVPAMRDEEYEQLKSDIAENGVRTKILVKGTQILDGIHRARAATEVGKAIPVEQFRGKDTEIDSTIVSLNVSRRHLTDEQRVTLLAWVLVPKLKAEAKERMEKGEESEEADKGKTHEKLSKEADVGARKARKAIDIVTHMPESDVKKIITGKAKFGEKAREARVRKLKASGKKPPVAKPKKEVDKLAPEYIHKRFGMFLKHWTHSQHRKVRAMVKEYLE